MEGNGNDELAEKDIRDSDAACAHHSWCHWRSRVHAGGESMWCHGITDMGIKNVDACLSYWEDNCSNGLRDHCCCLPTKSPPHHP